MLGALSPINCQVVAMKRETFLFWQVHHHCVTLCGNIRLALVLKSDKTADWCELKTVTYKVLFLPRHKLTPLAYGTNFGL